jgi:hypothetical protein
LAATAVCTPQARRFADCIYADHLGGEPEDEHRLLARTLLALFRFPILPAERLIGSLKTNPSICKPGSHDRLTNPAEVWSALDNEMRPSISYIVTLAFDPWNEITSPVVHADPAFQAEELPRSPNLTEGASSSGGHRRPGPRQDGAPSLGSQSPLRGRACSPLVTGRFILGSLLPG